MTAWPRSTHTAEQLAQRWPGALRLDPILGLVKRCTKCGEWWLATTAFFSTAPGKSTPLQLHSWCWACVKEAQRIRRRERRRQA